MGRLPRFRVGEIGELGRQLEYAPAEARRRHMEAAERLLAEIDPGRVYPLDFVVFRITGYRPDPASEPVSLVGEALVADLVMLIQRLSEGLDLPGSAPDNRAIRFEDVAGVLNVSSRTLQRYRRQGLVCHFAVFPGGEKRLACFRDRLERFVDGHRERLERAASFARMGPELRRAIVEEARGLRASRGLTLNAAALELAARHGRAHETVRAILRRHERSGAEPIFAERGPLSPRDQSLIFRAARWGVPPALIARRFGRTRATVHRAINARRRDLLRRLDLRFVPPPTIDRPDAEAVLLAAPAATTGLDAGPRTGDALALIEALRGSAAPEGGAEPGLIAAFNMLKRRAARAVGELPEHPGSEALDAIETDLRWAALLKRRLVWLGLPAAIRAAEQAIHRPLVEQPSEEILGLLRSAVEVASRCAETIDLRRGQKLAGFCGFSMSRALAAGDPPRARRAASRHLPGSVHVPDLLGGVVAWTWLELREDLKPRVAELDDAARSIVEARYGLGGGRPLRIAEIARRLGRPASSVAAALRRAESRLRRLNRARPMGGTGGTGGMGGTGGTGGMGQRS